MYDAVVDPACYPGTAVLENRPGLRAQAELDRFEAVATGRRFMEPMPVGRWSVAHYRAIHRHIFQDVYRWAGRFRSIRISKGDSTFCYPENVPAEMRRVFRELRQAGCLRRLDQMAFSVGAAHLLAELNAIHPFRDGNGRSQLVFLVLLARQAGHPLDLERLEPGPFLTAMIRSFHGDETLLRGQVLKLLATG